MKKLVLFLSLISTLQIFGAAVREVTIEVSIPGFTKKLAQLWQQLNQKPDVLIQFSDQTFPLDKVKSKDPQLQSIIDAVALHLKAFNTAVKRVTEGQLYDDLLKLNLKKLVEGQRGGTREFVNAKFQKTLESLSNIEIALRNVKVIKPNLIREQQLLLEFIYEIMALIRKDRDNYNLALRNEPVPPVPAWQRPPAGPGPEMNRPEGLPPSYEQSIRM